MAAKNEQLKALLNKIKGNKPAFVDIARIYVVQWLTENAEILADMNREQLSEGFYANGDAIQPGYSELWGEIRGVNGKQTEFVDLNFEGDFYKSIIVKPMLNQVFFDTSDFKIRKTKLQRGGKVDLKQGGALGLNAENALQVGWLAAAGIRDNLMKYLVQ